MIKIKEELKSFVRPSPHSKFSPSSIDRWMGCPASIALSEGIEETTSKYAKEGTIAHELCEHVYRKRMYGIDIPAGFNLELSMLPDHGAEMEEHAENYVDLLESWLTLENEIGDVVWHGIERGIPIYPEKGCFGTGDFIIIGTKGAVIIDFKYGKGKDVPATSPQLKAYALGAYLHCENIPDDYEWNVVVFQPRTFALPKCHAYNNDEMKTFSTEVFNAILETEKDNLEPVISSSHCHWCPARKTPDPDKKCPAQKQRQVDVATKDFDSFLTDMNAEGKDKRDKALMKLLSLFPLIEQVCTEAEDERSEERRVGKECRSRWWPYH